MSTTPEFLPPPLRRSSVRDEGEVTRFVGPGLRVNTTSLPLSSRDLAQTLLSKFLYSPTQN